MSWGESEGAGFDTMRPEVWARRWISVCSGACETALSSRFWRMVSHNWGSVWRVSGGMVDWMWRLRLVAVGVMRARAERVVS